MKTCAQCDLYEHLRGDRIKLEISKRSEGEAARARWDRFIAAYHARHTARDDSEFTVGRFVALMASIQDMSEREESPSD